ncbi:MAG: DUF1122 family protein [Syntrophobacterales bacterium]|nr:MAG: DUF1122 family protein [Syntrophobacterales bacterium]
MKGVPSVSTAQGELLFRAGFRLVKDWYLAEGGHEGPRKLWGEKPFNRIESLGFDLKTFLQLLAYLSRPPDSTSIERERRERGRALAIVKGLDLDLNLSALGKGIIRIYQKGFRSNALGKAALHTCHRIEEMLKTTYFEDAHTREKLSQISRSCSEGI